MSASISDEQGPSEVAKSSKADAIIALLKQDDGATLEQMMDATGWQKHSVRGFLAGALKKRHGITAKSTKADGVRTYRAEIAA
jgi:hypothetical protein